MAATDDIRLVHPLVLIDHFRRTVADRGLVDESVPVGESLALVMMQLAQAIDRHHLEVERVVLASLRSGDIAAATALIEASIEGRQ